MKIERRQPPDDPALKQAAAAQPGGWIYDMDWSYRPDRSVPPEAIRGSWKVGGDGRLTGEYAINERYRPVQTSQRSLPAYMRNAARALADDWMVEIDPRAEHLFPAIPETLQVGFWYVDKQGRLTNQFRANALYDPATPVPEKRR